MAKPRSFLIAFGLISAGTIILMVGIGYYFLLNAGQNPDSTLIPDYISELPLINLTTGQEALHEINQLHGKAFPLTSGAVGSYGSEDLAIIWVAAATDNTMAAEILRSMRDRIAEGNSPFTPARELKNGNRTIYTLDGLGQKHFYFQSENLIVWTGVDASLYETVLQQVLDFYP